MPASINNVSSVEAKYTKIDDNSKHFESKTTIKVGGDGKSTGALPKTGDIHETADSLSFLDLFIIYFCYINILIFGYLEELVDKIKIIFGRKPNPFSTKPGYAPLFKELEYFWLTRIYQKLRDLFERPICGLPGAKCKILNRATNDGNATFYFTGGHTECLNFGSYNYLGFAQNEGPVVKEVRDSMSRYSYAVACPRMEAGRFDIVDTLEKTIARHVGKPAAMVFGMGYATNSTTLPAICGGKGSLIISDALNHNSIVTGCKDSGARILVFKHNDADDLEKILRNAIIEGQPRTRRAWKRIVIVVEGIYSMEGEICRLPEIVALKHKYKAYLYVDEAHSIGALGNTGRGVCEHWGVNPDDIDVLMGTFTKAFGSVGGYIATSEEFISYLRNTSYGSVYATAMSPPCAQQALSALKLIMGEDGTDDGKRRIQQLKENSNFFRSGLAAKGFHIIGDMDSPIVPMMMYHPIKMPWFSRELLKAGIAIVIVGFPVTPLLLSRVRFCISASHTREQLQYAIDKVDEFGEVMCLKYAR
jgi:serine palmitoyltransferase